MDSGSNYCTVTVSGVDRKLQSKINKQVYSLAIFATMHREDKHLKIERQIHLNFLDKLEELVL